MTVVRARPRLLEQTRSAIVIDSQDSHHIQCAAGCTIDGEFDARSRAIGGQKKQIQLDARWSSGDARHASNVERHVPST